MNIGKSINVSLAMRGMTRRQLSEKSGSSMSYISQVVQGNFSPKADTIKRYAKAVDMPVSEFIKLGE